MLTALAMARHANEMMSTTKSILHFLMEFKSFKSAKMTFLERQHHRRSSHRYLKHNHLTKNIIDNREFLTVPLLYDALENYRGNRAQTLLR